MKAVTAVLLASLFAALACATVIPNLSKPDVNVDTDYYVEYDPVLGQNKTYFSVYRVNSVLAYSLVGDNAASSGGEIGFLLYEYGQTSGYILKYCTEVLLPPGAGYEELAHGVTNAFASYECCGGGSCSNCGYTGSGLNPNPNMVGRSYNLDVPPFAPGMAKAYGWWYSFNNAGLCDLDQPLGTNGCTYHQSPYVDVVTLQSLNVLPQWTQAPSTAQQWQIDNNILVNAYNSDLMTAFYYNISTNVYSPLGGRVTPDPANKCNIQCPFGTYSSTGVISGFSSAMGEQCTPCPRGTYAASVGSTSCTPCPAGMNTNNVGAVSSAACYSSSTPSCAAGTYNPYTGHSPCTPCPIGTYAHHHSATACQACPAYSTTTSTGSASASSCILNSPQAFLVYSNTPTSAVGDLSGQVLSDVNGTVNLLQTQNYGTVNANETLSVSCVETVVANFASANGCYGTYCTYTNPSNLPVSGPAPTQLSPNTNWNGNFYSLPASGECTPKQHVGEGGCTWKASTVVAQAQVYQLANAGLFSCAYSQQLGLDADADGNPACNYTPMTLQQWQASTNALQNIASIGNLASTTTTAPGVVLGAPAIENGRCTIQCPAGYSVRSAFTAPYCEPTSATSTLASFLASDATVEEDVDARSNNVSAGVIVGTSVALVAVVAVFGAVIAYRRNRYPASLRTYLTLN